MKIGQRFTFFARSNGTRATAQRPGASGRLAVELGVPAADFAISVLLAASAFAADSIISLPSTAVADLTGNASQILSDVWVLVALAIGIPLGFYLIRKVIALIPKH